MSTTRLLLKLALRACERGDVEGAAEALRGALVLDEARPAATVEPPLHAISVTEFARQFGFSARHVAKQIERGEIPPDAVIGRGRGRRVLIAPALEALRVSASTGVADEIEREGAEYVQRRGRLRVVDKMEAE